MCNKPIWNVRSQRAAFSMVEVALAIGIVSFALLAVMALLPLGVKSNKISSEETRASMILTTVEADLRNTHPLAVAGGKSALFKLLIPYAYDSTAKRVTFAAITPMTATSILTEGIVTTGLNDAEEPIPTTSAPRPRYQVSVIYGPAPAGNQEAMRARLVVNWPALPGARVVDITNPTKVAGYIESIIYFPSPP